MENGSSCQTGRPQELEHCIWEEEEEEEAWTGRLSSNSAVLVKTLMLRGRIQQEPRCSLLVRAHVAVGLPSRGAHA